MSSDNNKFLEVIGKGKPFTLLKDLSAIKKNIFLIDLHH